MTGLGRRIGLYGLATVLPSAVTFLFLPILTRQMPRSDFGTLSALTALYNLFFIAFTFYLDRSLVRFYFRYQGESRRELIGNLFISVAILATFGMLVTIGLSPTVEKLYPEISAHRLVWYAASVYFNAFIYFARSYYAAAEQPTQYLWLSMGMSAATLLCLCWFVLVRREGIEGWLKASTFANALMAVPAVLILAKASTIRLSWRFIREAMAYAGPMIPAFFCGWLSQSVDRLFVGRWAGMSANALYGAAAQLSNILPTVFIPIYAVYAPLFFRLSGSGDRDRGVALACNRLLMLLISMSGCIFITAAPLLTGTILPATYNGVSGTFSWLVVAASVTLAASVGQTALYHSRRTDLVLLVTAAAALASVVTDVTLIPLIGREGAVIGQLLASFVLLAGHFTFARRTFGNFVDLGCAARNIAAVVVMGILAEAQARVAPSALWLVLELVVLIWLGIQLWTEKDATIELWSRNLWQSEEEVPVPVA